MQQRGLDRYAPLAGVLFFIGAVVAIFVLSNNEPDADAKLAKVVKYWSDHDSREIANGVLAAIGAILLVWFGGALRAALWRAEGGSGRLSTVAFAGIVMAAVGLTVGGAITFTAADTAGDVSPQVTQTLSALNSDFFFPFAAGFMLMLLATALVALRTGAVIPKWLAWVAIALAVISVTPLGFVGFLGALVWIPIVSVLLFLRGEGAAPAAGAPATGPAGAGTTIPPGSGAAP